MDYKYIDQLLERYWRCETSLEEEEILRTFFSQQDLPAELKRYQALFAYEQKESKMGLGDDFDRRMMARIEESDGQAPVLRKRIAHHPSQAPFQSGSHCGHLPHARQCHAGHVQQWPNRDHRQYGEHKGHQPGFSCHG